MNYGVSAQNINYQKSAISSSRSNVTYPWESFRLWIEVDILALLP